MKKAIATAKKKDSKKTEKKQVDFQKILNDFVVNGNILIEKTLKESVEKTRKEVKQENEILYEKFRDDNRIYQDQINELRDLGKETNKKLFKIERDLSEVKENIVEMKDDIGELRELESEVRFIKDFLIDNLEPRIMRVETR